MLTIEQIKQWRNERISEMEKNGKDPASLFGFAITNVLGDAIAHAEQAEQAERALAEVKEENLRLAKEHTQCHEWNGKLVHEHYDLGDVIRTLRTQLAEARRAVHAAQEALESIQACAASDEDTESRWYAIASRALVALSPRPTKTPNKTDGFCTCVACNPALW